MGEHELNYNPRHAKKGENMFEKIAAWFTTKRRQAIQLFAVSLAPLAVLAGIGAESEWTQGLLIFGAVLQFGSNLLNLVNVRVGDLPAIYAVIRGAVYTLGATVAPALVTLQVISPEIGDKALTAISLGLAALGNLVAVLTSQRQLEDSLKLPLDQTYNRG